MLGEVSARKHSLVMVGCGVWQCSSIALLPRKVEVELE